MKSLEELAAIRAKMLEQVSLRKGDNIDTRIVVGMATCGIAAGARPVMLEFIEELKRRGIENATVSQTGCVGVCRLEPIVEVYVKGQEKVTYVHMTPEKVARVVSSMPGSSSTFILSAAALTAGRLRALLWSHTAITSSPLMNAMPAMLLGVISASPQGERQE